MVNSKLTKSFLLTIALMSVLLAPAFSAEKKEQDGLIGFKDGKVEAHFTIPDSKVWHQTTIEGVSDNESVASFILKREPITNKNGVQVKPILSLMLWKADDTFKNVEDLEALEIKRFAAQNFKIVSRKKVGTRITITGLGFYDHNDHYGILVLDFLDHTAMVPVCDTYSDIYSQVETDFQTWSKSVRLTLRSSRTPPVLPYALSQHLAISAPLIVSVQARPLSFLR